MLHRRLRIGDLIYDLDKKAIVCFNTNVFKEIEGNIDTHNYVRIPLNSKWLTEVFEFDSKYLNMQYMTVYTSRINSFKIHEQHSGFSLSCTFRDKIKNQLGEGMHVGKPKVTYVDELTAYLSLMANQEFYFEDKLEELNELFSEYRQIS
ncbi:hypothetical protein D7030_01410 [Flavobacteriaceae bacterium AU392]|nr:hypothetical protein D1817_07865 [Flavobacteriaceae bacterium]RKM86537.1 hypothetical protein D7030_01410 [Flavobacteriaceae bacterium AU392]